MSDANTIRDLYKTYIETVMTLERNRKPGDGLLGLKPGPEDDPCHDRFAEDLERALSEFAARESSSAEVRDLLSYIYTVPLEHKLPLSLYWMLAAVHGLTLKLIDSLAPADAQALYQSYKEAYPRHERLPAQKKVLAALKRAQ